MKVSNSALFSFAITAVIFSLLEVVTTTVFPLFGLESVRFSFFSLLILFLSFYRNTTWIAVYIFAFSFIHSIFSIEVWYLSAFVGILVSVIVAYFSELIHLSNKFVTMLFVLLFQLGMALLKSIVFYLRGNNFEYIFNTLSGYFVEVIILTLLSPFIFEILSYIWTTKNDSIEEYN